MRVALLSTLEPAGDSEVPRGLLRVAGRTIVEHQLSAAIAFGCERVLCLAEGYPGKLISLQQQAERSGLGFTVVGSGHELARSIAPEDELLVLSGGLLAPASEMTALIEAGNGIVVQPAEEGVAAGFERLDLNHADGGVMRLPGGLALGLVKLPSDWNPISSLLRIAAQAGMKQRPLPSRLSQGGYWLLVRDEAEAQAIEPRWLRLHTSGAAARGPGAWLAAALVHRLGPALLHAGTRPRIVTLAAVLLAVAALALSWAELVPVALVLLGMAWVVQDCAELLGRIERDSLPLPRSRLALAPVFSWLLDAAFVVCCVGRIEQADGLALHRVPAAFIALTGFGLLRLLPRFFAERRWASWFDDRFVVGLLLAAASITPVFAQALMAATLLMIGLAMAASPRRSDAPGQAAPASRPGASTSAAAPADPSRRSPLSVHRARAD